MDTSIHWGASNHLLKLKPANLDRLRKKKYRIPDSIDLILSELDKQVCYPRPEYVAVSEAILRASLRLPIHPFFHYVLRSYRLALTQLNPNS